MLHSTTPEPDQVLGADELEHPTAREAQRATHAHSGEYLCEVCRTTFSHKDSASIVCPNCKNAKADLLTPLYVEDDPARDEMMGPEEFTAGD